MQLGAFLNSYLPYAFPALILVMTPNKPAALVANTCLIVAICGIIFLKIFGNALTADYGPAFAQWHDRTAESAALLAAAFGVVVLIALFFKALTMITTGKPARFLQYGAFLGPLVVLYWPAAAPWLIVMLGVALAAIFAFELWRRRKRPRIRRKNTPSDAL